MDFLKQLGLKSEHAGVSTGNTWLSSNGEWLESYSPVDGKFIGKVRSADQAAYEAAIQKAQEAFLVWRTMPAPR